MQLRKRSLNVDLNLPERLHSVDKELKILAVAVEALSQPGLSRAEVYRLINIIVSEKVCQKLFASFLILWVRVRSFEVERFLKFFRQPTPYENVFRFIKQVQDHLDSFNKIPVDYAREGLT